MKESDINKIVSLFNKYIDDKNINKSYIVSDETIKLEKDNAMLISLYKVQNNSKNIILYFNFYKWWRENDNSSYIIIQSSDRKNILVEIKNLNNSYYEWRYKPTKRDKKNPQRKEYFVKYFGTADVKISEPNTLTDIENYLDDIFEIANIRLKSDSLSPDLPAERTIFIEGTKVQKLHFSKERNSELISFVKQKFKENHGNLFCEVCGFDFEKVYGTRGKDFIEAHHTKPLSTLNDNGEETKPEDIILVCSNCHQMIHRTRPWLKAKDLKSILNQSD